MNCSSYSVSVSIVVSFRRLSDALVLRVAVLVLASAVTVLLTSLTSNGIDSNDGNDTTMVLIPAMAMIPAMVITSDGNDTTIVLIPAMAMIPAMVITSDGNDTSNDKDSSNGNDTSNGYYQRWQRY